MERIKVHGKALEGNLEGDSPDRDVSIYLPPSYATEQSRRYPVIYLLHGYTDNDDLWFGSKPHFINVPTVTDKALASGAREMIIVMPNAYTAYQGSMYSSSAVPQAIGKLSSRAIWCPTSTATIGPSLKRRAAAWLAIPWAAMEPFASG